MQDELKKYHSRSKQNQNQRSVRSVQVQNKLIQQLSLEKEQYEGEKKESMLELTFYAKCLKDYGEEDTKC